MPGKSLVLKPATFDISNLVIQKRDRTWTSLPNLSLSNGKEQFYSKGNKYVVSYIGFLNNGKRDGSGVLLFYRKHFFTRYLTKYIGRYEGFWKDGVPEGEGTFFDKNGDLIVNDSFTNDEILSGKTFLHRYEGALVNGKRDGFGILKNLASGNFIYVGEWKNGLYHGQGVLYDYKCKKYEGQFYKGLYHGKGASYHPYRGQDDEEKIHQRGTWKNGVFEKGKTFHEIFCETFHEIEYYGEGYYNEKKKFVYHGYGKYYILGFKSLTIHYEGQWKHGEKYGLGKAFHENKVIAYDGSWRKGKRNNYGKEYDEHGHLLYEGQWKQNRRDGFGLLYHREEFYLDYSGDFKNNRKHGKGTRYYANGNIFYEGLYADNKRHGKGTKFYQSGSRDEVHYRQGMLHGPVVFYENDGKTIKKKGKYIENKFIDESMFSIRKFLETNDMSDLKKINKNDLSRYIQENFKASSSLRQSKEEIIEMLKLLHFKAKTETTSPETEVKEDLFGNRIETPCRGNDGEIYDLTSMEYLFKKKDNGRFKNIRYIYENGISIPNYPIMSNGIRLSSFSIINQQEK